MRPPLALFGSIFATLLMQISVPRAQAQDTPSDGAVAQLMAQGNSALSHRDYAKAMHSFEQAEKLSHHTCPECLFAEIGIYKKAGDFSSALDCAKKAESEAGSNKPELARALTMRANLLAATSSKPKDKKLAEAVSDTRQALALQPQNAIAQFNLGVLLMKQEQDADGVAALKAYLAISDIDAKTAADARAYIADPRRAREPFAPDFSFTTLENEQISLASLRGKVALLDFWGTWCPPCRESIPTIASLERQFSKKGVAFVGISSDSDEGVLRKFVAANHMTWPEYLDDSDRVQEAFSVDSFPTYIVLDRNGIVRFRQSGFAEQASAQEISDALNKALKEKTEEPPSPAASAPPDPSAATAATPLAESAASSSSSQQGKEPAAANAPFGNPEPVYIRKQQVPIAMNERFILGLRIVTSINGADSKPLMAAMSSQVKDRWAAAMPSEAQQGRRGTVAVEFTIGRDGQLVGPPAVSMSSGNDALDAAALAAVSAAAPFSPLPDTFPDQIQVQAFFLYNETPEHTLNHSPSN